MKESPTVARARCLGRRIVHWLVVNQRSETLTEASIPNFSFLGWIELVFQQQAGAELSQVQVKLVIVEVEVEVVVEFRIWMEYNYKQQKQQLALVNHPPSENCNFSIIKHTVDLIPVCKLEVVHCGPVEKNEISGLTLSALEFQNYENPKRGGTMCQPQKIGYFLVFYNIKHMKGF